MSLDGVVACAGCQHAAALVSRHDCGTPFPCVRARTCGCLSSMAGRPVDSVRCAVFHETSGIVEHAPAQHCGPANRATAKPNPRTASIPRKIFCSMIRIHDLTRKKGDPRRPRPPLRTMADEDGDDPDNTRLYQVLGVDKSVRSATAAPPRASSCIHQLST